ncbi:MAG: CAP domain-containing protein, partial [Akkermansiaceae bacterium]
AEKHNADCKWANGSQKSFSDHLNKQRALLGLQPLLLEERLSAASFGHSQDMRSAGFFSHTSPIPGKRSPADRARKAKFKGSWTGENIFMGSPSPMAAYGGWFGSDGHRFIMFTRGGSNVIGVGVAGGHWTMMTGRQ